MSWLTDFLFGKKPDTPAPPDYATAAKTGIETDLATLPLRNAINAASQLGTKYTDPATGKVYDFTGLGQADINAADLQRQLDMAPDAAAKMLELQKQYGTQFADEARNQLKATDPEGFALRESLAKRLGGGQGSIESVFSGGGGGLQSVGPDGRIAQGQPPPGGGAGGLEAPNFEQYEGYGPDLGRLDASQNPSFQRVGNGPAMDRLDLSQLPQLDRIDAGRLPSFQGVDLNTLPAMERIAAQSRPSYESVAGARLADRGASAAGRSDLERQVFDELARAGSGQLDPVLATAAQQASRARGAAAGNTLGDSSALNESLAVQLAQQQRNDQSRGNALGLLQSGQTTSDKRNDLSLQQLAADVQSKGFNNAGKAQSLQDILSTAGFNNAGSQQELNNRVGATNLNNENSQRTYTNLADLTGRNNATSQQGFDNLANATAFNNGAAQSQYDNALSGAGFNNAAAQQGFQNSVGVQGFNNDAAGAAFNNAMAAIGQRNQASQNTFGAQQGLLQQKAGARQQDLGNIQSFLGLQPVVSQGSQLSGLQNGAAPFMTGSGYSSTLSNPGATDAGTGFAGNIFGTQSGIYGTQAGVQANRGFTTAFQRIAGSMGGITGKK